MLKIRIGKDDPRHTLDEEKKSVRLGLERQPYIPMAVFKCLVKMALAIMPDDEAVKCAHLKKWILEDDHTFESYPYRPLNVFYQFAPGPLPTDRFGFVLIRRKEIVQDWSPYMQFVLQMSNHLLQIILPMHVEDEKLLRSGHFETLMCPSGGVTVEHQIEFGVPGRKTIDMSETSVMRGDVASLTFSYDKLADPSPTLGDVE